MFTHHAAARGARMFSTTAPALAAFLKSVKPYKARGVGRVRSELMVPAPKVQVDVMEADERIDWRQAQQSDTGTTAITFAEQLTGYPTNVLVPLFARKAFMITNQYGAVFPADGNYRMSKGDHLGIPKTLPDHLYKRLEGDAPVKKKLSLAEIKLIRSMVIYKNPDCFVINKPPGAPCEPSKGSGLSIYELLDGLKFDPTDEPVIVNKLEKEVSGCMIIARNKEAHRFIEKHLYNPRFPNFCFWGVIAKKPKGRHVRGRVEMHLEVARSAAGDRVVVRVEPGPKTQKSKLEYAVVSESRRGPAWVTFYPITHRRHELRIAASMVLKSPLLGDTKYGGDNAEALNMLDNFVGTNKDGLPLHLHCHQVVLPFEDNRNLRVTIKAPLPKHMEVMYNMFGWNTKFTDPYLLDFEGAPY